MKNPHQEITIANKTFMRAFAEGDIMALTALYSPTAQLLPPNSGPISIPKTIGAFWQGVMNMGIKQVRLETLELEDLEETVIESGKYSLLGTNEAPMDHGKYLVVWKLLDGQWKLHRDIWNTSVAAQ